MGVSCGCSKVNFISNASPYQLKIKIHQDEERIKHFEKKKEGHANVKGGIDMASIDIGVSAENKEKGIIKYVDENFEGFEIVTPNTTQTLNVPSGSKYISVYVLMPGSKVFALKSNSKITNNDDEIQVMVGKRDKKEGEIIEDESELLEFVEAASRFERWRAKDQQSSQNYYGDKRCRECGEKKACKKSCVIFSEYKGYCKDNYFISSKTMHVSEKHEKTQDNTPITIIQKKNGLSTEEHNQEKQKINLEKIKLEEDKKIIEENAKKKIDEAKQNEIEAKAKELEAKHKEMEANKREEEARLKVEEANRKFEEAMKLAEDAKLSAAQARIDADNKIHEKLEEEMKKIEKQKEELEKKNFELTLKLRNQNNKEFMIQKNLEYVSFDSSGRYMDAGTHNLQDLNDKSALKGICVDYPYYITIELNGQHEFEEIEIAGYAGNTTIWYPGNGDYSEILTSKDKDTWKKVGSIPSGYGKDPKTIKLTKSIGKYIKFKNDSYLGIGYLKINSLGMISEEIEYVGFESSGQYPSAGTHNVQDLKDISCMKGICANTPGWITVEMNGVYEFDTIEVGGWKANSYLWSPSNGAGALIKTSKDNSTWIDVGKIPLNFSGTVIKVSLTNSSAKYIKFQHNSYLGLAYLKVFKKEKEKTKILNNNSTLPIEFLSFESNGTYSAGGKLAGTNNIVDITDKSLMKGICATYPGWIIIELNDYHKFDLIQIGGWNKDSSLWAASNGAGALISTSEDKITWNDVGYIPSDFGATIRDVYLTKSLARFVRFKHKSYLGIGYLNIIKCQSSEVKFETFVASGSYSYGGKLAGTNKVEDLTDRSALKGICTNYNGWISIQFEKIVEFDKIEIAGWAGDKNIWAASNGKGAKILTSNDNSTWTNVGIISDEYGAIPIIISITKSSAKYIKFESNSYIGIGYLKIIETELPIGIYNDQFTWTSNTNVGTVEYDDKSKINVNANCCYNYYLLNLKKSKTTGIVNVTFETDIIKTDGYFYFGVINNEVSLDKNCMCCIINNATYIQSTGQIIENGIEILDKIHNLRFLNTGINKIYLKVDFSEKKIYFSVNSSALEGPYNLIGNNFTITSGTCNSANGYIKVISYSEF